MKKLAIVIIGALLITTLRAFLGVDLTGSQLSQIIVIAAYILLGLLLGRAK